MEDHERDSRLESLEKRVDRLITVVATGVGIAALAVIFRFATQDWEWSNIAASAIAGVAFFGAFLWLVIGIKAK